MHKHLIQSEFHNIDFAILFSFLLLQASTLKKMILLWLINDNSDIDSRMFVQWLGLSDIFQEIDVCCTKKLNTSFYMSAKAQMWYLSQAALV